MDTFGAMALASLPPSASVMNDKPRRREASILTRPMMTELLGVGLFFFALTLGFYWLFNHAEVTSITQMFSAVVGGENDSIAHFSSPFLYGHTSSICLMPVYLKQGKYFQK